MESPSAANPGITLVPEIATASRWSARLRDGSVPSVKGRKPQSPRQRQSILSRLVSSGVAIIPHRIITIGIRFFGRALHIIGSSPAE